MKGKFVIVNMTARLLRDVMYAMVRSYASKYTKYYKWRGKTIVVEAVPAFVRNHYHDILIEGQAIIAIDELL